MPSILEQNAISDAQEAEIAELQRRLEDDRASGRRGVHEIALPDKLYRLLMKIIEDLASGKAVSLTSAAQELRPRISWAYRGSFWCVCSMKERFPSTGWGRTGASTLRI
jgi:hypothetical protein